MMGASKNLPVEGKSYHQFAFLVHVFASPIWVTWPDCGQLNITLNMLVCTGSRNVCQFCQSISCSSHDDYFIWLLSNLWIPFSSSQFSGMLSYSSFAVEINLFLAVIRTLPCQALVLHLVRCLWYHRSLQIMFNVCIMNTIDFGTLVLEEIIFGSLTSVLLAVPILIWFFPFSLHISLFSAQPLS